MSLLRRFLPCLRCLAVAAVAVSLAGAVFLYGGFYNIAATARHTWLVYLILDEGMREAVQFHARNVAVPDLSHPSLVPRGLQQFQSRCASCHGAPGEQREPLGEGLQPQAPDLSRQAAAWRERELFWIIKHGLKMTGMPAWQPTHRDDEVWALVAFLLALPALTPEQYQSALDIPGFQPTAFQLATTGTPAHSALSCARCHGLDGEGGGHGAFPRLSGLQPDYFTKSMEDFARERRPSGLMGPISRALSPAQIATLAEFYAGRPAKVGQPGGAADPAQLRRGRDIAVRGLPAQGVQACDSCHARPAGAPSLEGQYAAYIALQLDLWRRGARGGDWNGVMRNAAAGLGDADIEAVAAYYQAQPVTETR